MNESSDDPPLLVRIRSWARTKARASNRDSFGADEARVGQSGHSVNSAPSFPHHVDSESKSDSSTPSRNLQEKEDVADKRSPNIPPPAPPPHMAKERDGEESSAIEKETKQNVYTRFWIVTKTVILSSWINWLLLFVPVGIALGALRKAKGEGSAVSPTVVFAINAIAIIPLASLLCFATESVASKLGDTWGALMNVTFGNAVELIIFIIALAANEIRIVQASLLGSILANLLLILGMCFLFGGLRFREQLYNPAVSQMSACLLSLSVMSLLLPTAFHASFNSTSKADQVVIKVSRGTSVVLLLVYVLYLLFQLKSHAYMYESTPQHMIDEESHPGVLAEMLNSSSSSDSSSSSSDSDTSSSSGSQRTAKKRIKRALRRRRRKSSASSKEIASQPSFRRTSSSLGKELGETPTVESPGDFRSNNREILLSGDEADTEHDRHNPATDIQNPGITSRDFELEQNGHEGSSRSSLQKHKKKSRSKKSMRSAHKSKEEATGKVEAKVSGKELSVTEQTNDTPRVEFASESQDIPALPNSSPRRPFNLRTVSIRPALPKVLSTSVFSQGTQPLGQSLPLPVTASGSGRSGLRRTNSLPDRLNSQYISQGPPPTSAQPLPHLMPVNKSVASVDSKNPAEVKKHLSRTSAIVLLLVSTGLVAASAEFLVDSIDYLVDNTGVSQAFIGLIVLPIVGNAAEHVTAVTVASKNKMDLAIGVALGSSIQIALFVTPVIVLLGWCLSRDMSLYFSLFETVSLFVSAFIVNYLMIDGRSNYLEGALLIAAYVIIAVAAFFYPSCENLSTASGPTEGGASC